MDLYFFKDKIIDELDGALCYAKTALEFKAMSSSFSKSFIEMSATELQHAQTIYHLFDDYYKTISKPYDELPQEWMDVKDEIIDIYGEKSVKVKAMHELYNK